jgi:3-oxoacyl-[acyl-carrier-protein] synthase III
MKAGVFGVGAAVPHDVIKNTHLESRLDTTDEWIVKRTGIQQRHWLNGTQSLADLAVDACAAALADAGRRPEEVDRVLVASLTPDRLTPGLAPEVAARLGAHEAGAADVNAACAGFLVALDDAAGLVESARARCVLVVGAEALSRIIDYEDRSTAVLFGDGAGAVVVAGGELERGLPPFEVHSDGVNGDLLYAERDERLLRMHGREVYRHAVKRMTDATVAALRRSGLQAGDIDLFVAHQANARIVEAAAAAVGVPPDRVVLNVDRMANTSSASIPLALWQAEQDGRLHPGATVALAAFGAGFVWAAGVISWKERALVCA